MDDNSKTVKWIDFMQFSKSSASPDNIEKDLIDFVDSVENGSFANNISKSCCGMHTCWIH